MQEAPPTVLPGFQLAAMEPEEVEALAPVPDVDHLGLRRVKRQFQATQDNPDPPPCFTCLRFRPGIPIATEKFPSVAGVLGEFHEP